MEILTTAIQGIDALLPVALTLGILAYFAMLTKIILHADNPTVRAQARSVVITGILILFVMSSTWGIIGMIQRSLGVPTGKLMLSGFCQGEDCINNGYVTTQDVATIKDELKQLQIENQLMREELITLRAPVENAPEEQTPFPQETLPE